MSGTSMAAPHVAGAAAIYKGAHGEASTRSIAAWLEATATRGIIEGNPGGTPDKLLFLP
jgi:subtilisin family serine protease